MHVSTRESQALARVFACLAEDLTEREVRERAGLALLDLLRADHFASYVWDEQRGVFGEGVWLNMDPANLARYETWFQHHDPITFLLQARRHATAVSEVLPHRELTRTAFFQDFLARDGLHWGINLHAFAEGRALGDLRIWRGRHRSEFEPRDKALLDLVEPAFIAALRRTRRAATAQVDEGPRVAALSPRERRVAQLLAQGRTDKEIARELGISVPTVRTYLRRMAEKTGATRRAALARWASGGGAG